MTVRNVVSKTVREINYHVTVFTQIGINPGYGFPLHILWKRENAPLTLIVWVISQTS